MEETRNLMLGFLGGWVFFCYCSCFFCVFLVFFFKLLALYFEIGSMCLLSSCVVVAWAVMCPLTSSNSPWGTGLLRFYHLALAVFFFLPSYGVMLQFLSSCCLLVVCHWVEHCWSFCSFLDYSFLRIVSLVLYCAQQPALILTMTSLW